MQNDHNMHHRECAASHFGTIYITVQQNLKVSDHLNVITIFVFQQP